MLCLHLVKYPWLGESYSYQLRAIWKWSSTWFLRRINKVRFISSYPELELMDSCSDATEEDRSLMALTWSRWMSEAA